MKKLLIFASLFATSAALAAGLIEDDSVAVSWNAWSRLVEITYERGADPMIVTLDIQTNRTGAATAVAADWISIGGEHVRATYGTDGLNVLSEGAGMRRMFWKPDADFPDQTIAAGALRAVVTGWTQADPPDYLVVDLVNASNRWYYTSEAALPGGIGSDDYRINKMVMRRIPAAGMKWTMGMSGTDKTACDGVDSMPQHYVKLTNDYYMAVFELTCGQALKFAWAEKVSDYYNALCITEGSNVSKVYQYYARPGNMAAQDVVPANEMNHGWLRGSTYSWPTDRHRVVPTRFLGKMRATTGVDFDLPTEAQWEFAARAGTGTMTPLGNFSKDSQASRRSNLWPIAWYDETGGGSASAKLNRVGTKQANAWGLYDMLGNIDECTLDWYDANYGLGSGFDTAKTYVEPEGPSSGSKRTYRGGYTKYSCTAMFSASRHGSQTWYGVRLMCPVNLQFPASEK